MNKSFLFNLMFLVIIFNFCSSNCMESVVLKKESVSTVLVEAERVQLSLEELSSENFDVKSQLKRSAIFEKFPKSLKDIIDIIALLGMAGTFVEYDKSGTINSGWLCLGVFSFIVSRLIRLIRLEEKNHKNNLANFWPNLLTSLNNMAEKFARLSEGGEKVVYGLDPSKLICLKRRFRNLNYRVPKQIKSAHEKVGDELNKLCSTIEPYVQSDL